MRPRSLSNEAPCLSLGNQKAQRHFLACIRGWNVDLRFD